MGYGLERIIDTAQDLRLAASVESVDALERVLASRQAPQPPPDLIISGLPAQADPAMYLGRLGAAGSRVLAVLQAADGRRQVTGLLKAGAHGCVGDQVDEEELLLAIRVVAAGGCHVGSHLVGRMISELPDPDTAGPAVPALRPALAPREAETLRYLAQGLTHREIGRRMGLTEATISTYVKRVRAKLSVRNKADLTRAAMEAGLLGPERADGARPGLDRIA